jgi:hypothetical protein
MDMNKFEDYVEWLFDLTLNVGVLLICSAFWVILVTATICALEVLLS